MNDYHKSDFDEEAREEWFQDELGRMSDDEVYALFLSRYGEQLASRHSIDFLIENINRIGKRAADALKKSKALKRDDSLTEEYYLETRLYLIETALDLATSNLEILGNTYNVDK